MQSTSAAPHRADVDTTDNKLGLILQQQLQDQAKAQAVDILILLRDSNDAKAGLSMYRTPLARREALIARLRESASRDQAALRSWLAQQGVASRGYWVTNVIAARVPTSLLPEIAARDEVREIESNAKQAHLPPRPAPGKSSTGVAVGIAWGVQKIRAPDVWALGYTGQGVVVAGQDTGYQWDHPALKDHYRGWNGISVSHDYNWHDAITSLIDGGINSCGIGLNAPCDDHGHGTHTMGTMVGDDGAGNQVGVAPGAEWIGCRNMEEGAGRPETYIDCFQWLLAPTDLAGSNADTSKAPDVINNSWGCPPEELCDATATQTMHGVVQNVRAAGIVVVVSAGNDGPGCNSITMPPAIYAESFVVGATTNTDAIAGFSSRGSILGMMKPNVSAPGVGIPSSIPTNAYDDGSGTSMAGPHVAGTVALMISANPNLRGDPDAIESILEQTAVPLTANQDCTGFPGANVPNVVFGHGRIDALAAVQAALALNPLFADGFED